jgi:arylsulfatase A-like enzyme
VVYTSDQGFYLGEHGWFDKRFMYEESLRTPLLMRYPKEIKAGVKIDQMIQNLDFAPTFLDYAGIPVPEDIQGESFRDVVNQKTITMARCDLLHVLRIPLRSYGQKALRSSDGTLQTHAFLLRY